MSKLVHFEKQAELDELAEFIRSKQVPHYAIGARTPTQDGSCGGRWDTGTTTHGYCYRRGIRLCDMSRCGGALYNAPANAAFQVQVVPTNVQYFEPVAAEVVVVQNGNINTNARVRFSAFQVAGSPQEAINEPAPTAATTAVVLSDHFLPTDYGPRPVGWGIFSIAALTKALDIFGWNPNGVAVDIYWLVYGNPINGQLPDGVQPGQPWEQMRSNPYYRHASFR